MYNTLNSNTREIRLLDLEPGLADEEVSCHLNVVSLDDPPEYETLSYVWGDQKITRDILVNGTTTAVTVNLDRALRCLRYPDQPRLMWVDALCINQKDVDERSHQVMLMGPIYSQCVEVQIWLGEIDDLILEPLPLDDLHLVKPADMITTFENYVTEQKIKEVTSFPPSKVDGSQASCLDFANACRILELLAEGNHVYEMPFFKITDFPKFEICPVWDNARRSLVNILSRPWWTRTWTVQEAVLPPKATVHLGKFSKDFAVFLSAQENYFRHKWDSNCCYSVCGLLWEQGPRLHQSFDPIDSLRRTRLFHERGQPKDSWEAFSSHFFLATERSVTDPHDCIYGLLGVLPGIHPEAPNYELDIATLFARATKRFLDRDKGLRMLRNVVKEQNNPYDIPSWCINWNEKVEPILPVTYNACGPYKTWMQPNSPINDKVLIVEATFLGRVQSIAGTWKDAWDSQDILNTLREWQTLVQDAIDTNDDTFFRILFFDNPIMDSIRKRTLEIKRMQEDDFAAAKSWWHWLSNLKPTRTLSDLYPFPETAFNESHITCLSRHGEKQLTRLFTTDIGLIGVAPTSAIQKDDWIVVCKGGREPFIFREYAERLEDLQDHKVFSFVTNCYVDGIMEGAAVEQSDVSWETVYMC